MHLNHLTDLPKEIITFSDDMDGLRKVPDNVPNQRNFKKNLHKPLTIFQILWQNIKVLVNIIMKC